MEEQQERYRIAQDPRLPRPGSMVLGRYNVIRVLGEGGFGVVYHARDERLGGEVALKVLDPEKSLRSNFAARFQQEITLVRQLRHHHSIKIWDAGVTENGCLYLAMEFLQGEPLDAVIARTRGISPARTAHIAAQVLKSLAEAHRQGIIHRDLKPANIMLCQLEAEDDYVKVLDFGIAKALSPEMAQVKTTTGQLNCTPAYAAPEVLRSQEIGPGVDLYSLGLTMLELLTGAKPMGGGSVFEVVAAQLSPEPVRIPAELEGTPFGEVLKRATAKPVEARYESALAMLQDLRALGPLSLEPLPPGSTPEYGVSSQLSGAALNSLAATTPAHVSTPSAAQAAPTKSAKAPILLVLLVVGLLGVGTFLAISMRSDGDGGAEETAGRREPVPLPAAQGAVSDALLSAENALLSATLTQLTADSTQAEEGIEAVEATADSTSPEPAVEAERPGDVAALEEAVVDGDSRDDDSAAGDLVADPEPDGFRTRVRIRSTPEGATVRRGGENIGRTPFDEVIEADEAEVELRLTASGYHSRRVTVDLAEDEPVVDVTLRPRSRDEDRSDDESSDDAERTDPFGIAHEY